MDTALKNFLKACPVEERKEKIRPFYPKYDRQITLFNSLTLSKNEYFLYINYLLFT